MTRHRDDLPEAARTRTGPSRSEAGRASGGLASSGPDPADRRRLLITITPAARDLVRHFVPEIVALQASVMQDIPEQDRRQFAAVLTRIREAIAAASP